MIKKLPAAGEQFIVVEKKSDSRAVLFEWLDTLGQNLDLSDERWLLETYFERLLTPALWRSYRAMKCASLLRETMWSMVAEHHSTLDFDYVAYTNDYLARFERAYNGLKQL